MGASFPYSYAGDYACKKNFRHFRFSEDSQDAGFVYILLCRVTSKLLSGVSVGIAVFRIVGGCRKAPIHNCRFCRISTINSPGRDIQPVDDPEVEASLEDVASSGISHFDPGDHSPGLVDSH